MLIIGSMTLTNEFLSDLIQYAKYNKRIIASSRMGHLLKLNYTQKCQYEDIWNPFTVVSRGIILDTNSKSIEAHPFNKFFNEFEYEKQGIQIPFQFPYWVTEKIDGVLIIPFRYQDELRFSSRGSFQNEYIEKAYQISSFKDLPVKQYTFMFELVSPEYSQGGFLVTKYEEEELILVGVRDNKTDQLLNPPEVIKIAHQYHLKPYRIIDSSFEKIQVLQKQMENSSLEGWVVFFNYKDGFLVKMKRIEYLNLFRSIKNINKKTIVKLLISNQFEDFLKTLPEELVKITHEIYSEIQSEAEQQFTEIKEIFSKIPESVKSDQRDFSLYIIKHYPSHLLSYLYSYKSNPNRDIFQAHFYNKLLKRL